MESQGPGVTRKADALQLIGRDLLALDGPNLISLLFVARVLTAHQVVALLTERGYAAEAWGAMRTCAEHAIDGCYILTQDTESRIDAFLDGAVSREKRHLEELAGIMGRAPNPTRSRVLSELLKKRLGDKPPEYRAWTTVSLGCLTSTTFPR